MAEFIDFYLVRHRPDAGGHNDVNLVSPAVIGSGKEQVYGAAVILGRHLRLPTAVALLTP